MSSSGRIGLNTTDPTTDVDIRADEFQIQRTLERKGLKINVEGNIESFDKTSTSATTGSEFILSYSRGVTISADFLSLVTGTTFAGSDEEAVDEFNELPTEVQNKFLSIAEQSGFITPPSVGDIIGSIRWVAESGSSNTSDKRGKLDQASIKAVVNAQGEEGISSDLVFSLASQAAGAAQVMVLDGSGTHQLTGSIIVTGDISANSINVTSITSSIVTSSIIFTEGSNIFGDGAEDTHLFNGSITASGTIRSSGSIVHGNVSASGNIVASGFISSSGRIQTLSHITASGNISSSGTIIGTINGGKF